MNFYLNLNCLCLPTEGKEWMLVHCWQLLVPFGEGVSSSYRWTFIPLPLSWYTTNEPTEASKKCISRGLPDGYQTISSSIIFGTIDRKTPTQCLMAVGCTSYCWVLGHRKVKEGDTQQTAAISFKNVILLPVLPFLPFIVSVMNGHRGSLYLSAVSSWKREWNDRCWDSYRLSLRWGKDEEKCDSRSARFHSHHQLSFFRLVTESLSLGTFSMLV